MKAHCFHENENEDEKTTSEKRILANGWSKDSTFITVCERASSLDLDVI